MTLHCRYLHSFEVFEKARLDGKPLPIKNKRRSTIQESDDDLDKQNKPTTVDSDPRSFIKSTDCNSLSIGSPLSGGDESKDPTINSSNSLIVSGEYKIGDRVNVAYGKGKTQRTYEAKVREIHMYLPFRRLPVYMYNVFIECTCTCIYYFFIYLVFLFR